MPLRQLMDKMFWKIQHKLGVEGTGPEGFMRGVRRLDMRDKTCKSLLVATVRRIGHEGQNFEIAFGDIGAVMFEGFQEG